MLFAHAFGCDQNMWRLITPAFEKDYRIVLFDYVGSGKSDLAAYDERRYASLDGFAQDVLEICAALDLSDVQLKACPRVGTPFHAPQRRRRTGRSRRRVWV